MVNCKCPTSMLLKVVKLGYAMVYKCRSHLSGKIGRWRSDPPEMGHHVQRSMSKYLGFYMHAAVKYPKLTSPSAYESLQPIQTNTSGETLDCLRHKFKHTVAGNVTDDEDVSTVLRVGQLYTIMKI